MFNVALHRVVISKTVGLGWLVVVLGGGGGGAGGNDHIYSLKRGLGGGGRESCRQNGGTEVTVKGRGLRLYQRHRDCQSACRTWATLFLLLRFLSSISAWPGKGPTKGTDHVQVFA